MTQRSLFHGSDPSFRTPSIQVFIIALTKAGFERTAQRYIDAGGKLPVVHVPGVLASNELRNMECGNWARQFGTNSMIGIGKAHRNAWKRAQTCTKAVIYEEDAHFAEHYDESVFLELLDHHAFVAIGNICSGKAELTVTDRFLHLVSTGKSVPRANEDGVYPLQLLWGAHAYAVNTHGLRILLERLPKIRTHVDLEMGGLKRHMSMVGLRPSMAFQNQAKSTQVSTSRTLRTAGRDTVSAEYLLYFKYLRLGSQDLSGLEILALVLVLAMLLPLTH